MKVIKYNMCDIVNVGTEETPILEEHLTPVIMDWSEGNEEIAKRQAHNGEYTIEDDGRPAPAPTQLDIVEAQVAYTAMMTDTLLEV